MNKPMKNGLLLTYFMKNFTFLFCLSGLRKPTPMMNIIVFANVAPNAEIMIPSMIASMLAPCLIMIVEVMIV